MEGINKTLKGWKPKVDPKLCKYSWQQLAKEIIEEFNAEKQYHSSVFMHCQKREPLAHKNLLECRELGKPYIKYWLALMTRKS